MTLKREMYLDTCSPKELRIRGLIRYHKHKLKEAKAVCNSYNLQANSRKAFSYLLATGHILHHKTIVSNLRHELNRLKGMDRVVVPKVTYYLRNNGAFVQRANRCLCGERLAGGEWYCPNCGRKILWDKMKQ